VKQREAKKPGRRKLPALAKRLFGRNKVEVSGGAHLKGQSVKVGGDVVGRDKLVAGDDIVLVRKGGRLININLPRSVQIAAGVTAAAMIAIAIVLFTTRTAGAKLDFEEGPGVLEKLEIQGSVEIVETGEPESSVVGRFAVQVPSGDWFEDPKFAKVPSKQPDKIPVLKGTYRLAPGVTARGTIILLFNDSVVCRIPASAVDWTPFECDISEYANKQVGLRVEYVAVSGRAGGLLHLAILQDSNAVWVDNIEITEAESDTVVSATIEPTATPSLTATATSIPSPTPRPAPTRAPRQAPTDAPAATETPTQPTVSPASVSSPTRTPAAPPLTFTWRPGSSRESGQNEAGQGIWAQEIFVEPSGGVPPYTVEFVTTAGDQRQTGLSFEVFGLFCIGQVGTITVQSADGQTVSERITVPAPICPTKTPTPTPTTPTHTPMPTKTYTPLPPPPTIVNGSFEQPALPPNSWNVFPSIPGWSLSFGPGIEVQNNYAGSPADGTQFVELDSHASSGIYQDLSTVPGVTYTLSFQFSARPGVADNVLEVRWGSSTLAVRTLDGTSLCDTLWQYYEYSVTATTSTTRLEFREAGISDSLGVYVDGVRIRLAQ